MPRKKKRIVLNWYPREEMIKGLVPLFENACQGQTFMTIRRGAKWGNRLSPFTKVEISISEDEKKPNIIGLAEVHSVTKTVMADILRPLA